MPFTCRSLCLLFIVAISYSAQCQETYPGSVSLKTGDIIYGSVKVNLNGPNSEMLEVDFTSDSLMRINIALVNHITIHDTDFYFRDVKYDYHEKYLMNQCVRLITGTLNCGIFKPGRENGDEKIFVKLPDIDFSKLVDIDFDYYHATGGWEIMAFGKCEPLKKKILSHTPGYWWTDDTPAADRRKMWSSWISEYNNCK